MTGVSSSGYAALLASSSFECSSRSIADLSCLKVVKLTLNEWQRVSDKHICIRPDVAKSTDHLNVAFFVCQTYLGGVCSAYPRSFVSYTQLAICVRQQGFWTLNALCLTSWKSSSQYCGPRQD